MSQVSLPAPGTVLSPLPALLGQTSGIKSHLFGLEIASAECGTRVSFAEGSARLGLCHPLIDAPLPIYTSALALTPINYLASLSQGEAMCSGRILHPQSTSLKTAAKHIFVLSQRERNSTSHPRPTFICMSEEDKPGRAASLNSAASRTGAIVGYFEECPLCSLYLSQKWAPRGLWEKVIQALHQQSAARGQGAGIHLRNSDYVGGGEEGRGGEETEGGREEGSMSMSLPSVTEHHTEQPSGESKTPTIWLPHPLSTPTE
ncbi:unnamed protein product [Pleuronectes platessa]|uniref:Uncharacterized protein n=1 Tax=Pleuronectes platessa TaxID=8262 RepID=A0A9N7W2T2_PLEPL|nr:unnamed protein product [Pleuronectes platessa]